MITTWTGPTRKNLQKEVEALKTEIDRIADSSNFNGLNLLDGSLSGGAKVDGTIGTTKCPSPSVQRPRAENRHQC